MIDLISIIMPIYNVEQYLPECLDSLMGQTFENIELIMVDDGSTDSSGDICERYSKQDERFRVIRKANGGVSSARNAGLDAARGSYIGFVDPDDWIANNMFQILYEDMKLYAVDIVTCAYHEVKAEGTTIEVLHKKGVFSSDEALDCLLQELRSYLWCRMYRREVFDGIRFPEGRNYEDITMLPQVIAKSRQVYYDDRALYYYRLKRGGSIVATNTVKNLKDYFDSYMDILRFIKKEKPEFAGRAVRGTVIGYLSQYKRLTVVKKVSGEQLDELKTFKNIMRQELGEVHQKNNLTRKQKLEFFMAMNCPRLFIWICRWYRKVIGRELG